MAKPKDPTDNPRQDPNPEESRDFGREHPWPRRHHAGRDRIVHVAITERRFAGGPPPTHEAYNAALEQWHRLPGSVMRPATEIRLKDQPPTASVDANAHCPSGIAQKAEQKP